MLQDTWINVHVLAAQRQCEPWNVPSSLSSTGWAAVLVDNRHPQRCCSYQKNCFSYRVVTPCCPFFPCAQTGRWSSRGAAAAWTRARSHEVTLLRFPRRPENSLYQFCSPERGHLSDVGDGSGHASADKPETPCLQMHFEKCQLPITSFCKKAILMLKGKTVRRQLLVHS